MTPSELSAIAARADAATPGPWWVAQMDEEAYDHGQVRCYAGRKPRVLLTLNQHFPCVSDAAFIAAARSDVPALVAEVRRLQALLAPAPGGEGEPPRPTDHGGEG